MLNLKTMPTLSKASISRYLNWGVGPLKNLAQALLCAFLVFLVLVTGTTALAQKAKIRGDYDALGALPTPRSLKKMDYVEFFNFQCPHCNALHQGAVKFLYKYRHRINTRFIPVLFSNQQDDALRLYYIAERFKKGSEVRKLIFDSQFKYRVDINDKDIIVQLAKLSGLAKEYAKHARANWVEKKLREGEKEAANVRLRATPTVVLQNVIKMEPKGGPDLFVKRIEDVTVQLLKQ